MVRWGNGNGFRHCDLSMVPLLFPEMERSWGVGNSGEGRSGEGTSTWHTCPQDPSQPLAGGACGVPDVATTKQGQGKWEPGILEHLVRASGWEPLVGRPGWNSWWGEPNGEHLAGGPLQPFLTSSLVAGGAAGLCLGSTYLPASACPSPGTLGAPWPTAISLLGLPLR